MTPLRPFVKASYEAGLAAAAAMPTVIVGMITYVSPMSAAYSASV